ncbi:uncharacterized protein [Amphiura filiformis]|uniref:uncharacterized protein n=1 Tax=Amphiura filiformis TaxID=82378 RepID=UPI003B21BD82
MASSDAEGDLPVTFADLGVTSEAATVQTFVGTRRPLSSLTTLEWLFLGIALLSTLGALGLTLERIIDVEKDTADATFAVLLLINIVFVTFYILNGVFGERAFEVLAFVIGVFVLLLYCVINYIQNPGSGNENIIKLTRLVLISVFGPVDIVLGLFIAKQYHDSKNLIFRTVGANVALQELCTKVFLCESLLKFDLQLTMSLVFLIMNDGLATIDLEEKLVLGIGISYGIIWICLGYLAMRYENKTLSWMFLCTSWMQPAYIVYKLVDLGLDWLGMISATIVVCSFFGLILRGSVFAVFILVYRNFGQGLKEKVLNIPAEDETRKVIDPQVGYGTIAKGEAVGGDW